MQAPKRKFVRATTNAGSRSFPLPPLTAARASSSGSAIPDEAAVAPSSSASSTAAVAARPFPARPFKRSRTEPSIATPRPSPNTLAGLPAELKLRILNLLSLSDALAFTLADADPVLRRTIRDANWSPWRKRWQALSKAEQAYDRYLSSKHERQRYQRGDQPNASPSRPPPTQATQNSFQLASQVNAHYDRNPTTAEERDLCERYKQCLEALHLTRAPTSLDELLLAIDAGACRGNNNGSPKGILSSVPASYVHRFATSLILGTGSSSSSSQAPICAFDHLEHAKAVELISFVGVFLATLRISCLFGTQRQGSSTRTARFLEAECRDALEHFFRARVYIPPPGSANRLTSEQQAFVDTDVYHGQVIKIQAFAGTGKTTSLIEYARRRPHRRMLYLAFNKAAAMDAKSKFPSNVECKTFHSLAWPHRFNKSAEIGPLRQSDIVERHLADRLPQGEKLGSTARGRDRKVLPTAVASYISATLDKFMSSDADDVLPEHVPWRMKDKTTLNRNEIVAAAKSLWQYIKDGRDASGNSVACPHDAYVKMLHVRGPQTPDPIVLSDIFLLDEAQDMSLCQIAILKRTFPQWGGVIIVGDLHQKIYDFRGASSMLFDDDFLPPTRTFHLTQSFRFGERVAQTATTLVRLKTLPDWARNRTKPRLSGLKSIDDAVYWADGVGGAERVFVDSAGRIEHVPSSLVWAPSAEQDAPLPVDSDGFEVLWEVHAGANGPQAGANSHAQGVQVVDDDGYNSDGVQIVDEVQNTPTQSQARDGQGRSFLPIEHTRIYRSNARLLRDAMMLNVAARQANLSVPIFLKTSANMTKDSLIRLLTDAHKLYHGERIQGYSPLREYKSWNELVQRADAEELSGSTSAVALVISLENDLARSDWLQVVQDLKAQFVDRAEDAVIVMTTTHQAKGLEWDRVLLSDDFRPQLMSEATKQTEFSQAFLQSEINLMYVAATRAKKELYLDRTFMHWLSVMNGYSRLELDDARDGTRCSKCNDGDALFLRRKVRIVRRDPLWVDDADVNEHGERRDEEEDEDGVVHALVDEPYLVPEDCAQCLVNGLASAAPAENGEGGEMGIPLGAPPLQQFVVVSDFVDSVAAMQSVRSRVRRERDEGEERVGDGDGGQDGSAAEGMNAVLAGQERNTTGSRRTGTSAPHHPHAPLLNDGDAIPMLNLGSAAREDRWATRLLVEKNALGAELKACAGRRRRGGRGGAAA